MRSDLDAGSNHISYVLDLEGLIEVREIKAVYYFFFDN